MLTNIFMVPVKDKVLLHAPLHGVTALVNCSGAKLLQSAIVNSDGNDLPRHYQALRSALEMAIEPPKPRQGGLGEPQFLGLLPTRDCNMRCLYCDFPLSHTEPVMTMSQSVCQTAIDAYFKKLIDLGYAKAAIHFFGGEPFVEEQLVFFAAEYGRYQAQKLGLSLHLEASSNGLVNESFATWISETFDCLVLSLDGQEAIQNFQRPAKRSTNAFKRIYETARILSESPCQLILRSCITRESLPEMHNTVTWMVEQFIPETICLEPMSESKRSIRSGLHPPDPWEFSRSFIQANAFLEEHGINCMLSTADLSLKTVSSCPVGHDALILSPTGEINACYLPNESWEAKHMDMHLGFLKDDKFDVAQSDLDRVRSYELEQKPLCQNCFCRFHCAGGCHVNHPAGSEPGAYDDICIHTRLVSIGKLLLRLNERNDLEEWLRDRTALEKSALFKNDRIEALQ
jgi:radical SAM protein with 4Fe4S-binding SPASM domain